MLGRLHRDRGRDDRDRDRGRLDHQGCGQDRYLDLDPDLGQGTGWDLCQRECCCRENVPEEERDGRKWRRA